MKILVGKVEYDVQTYDELLALLLFLTNARVIDKNFRVIERAA